jgi:predicted enzyme related to lactoylglutathione lyase
MRGKNRGRYRTRLHFTAGARPGATIISAPVDGPFGRTFTFADPDGYQVTLHDRG